MGVDKLIDVSSKCVLTSLSITLWRPSRLDRAITREIQSTKQIDASLPVRFTKALARKEHLDALETIQREARETYKKYTLPWSRGIGMLPADAIFAYCGEMRQYSARFDPAADDFAMNAYPEILREAPGLLGAAFDPSDFPQPDRIRKFFELKFPIMPFPVVEDFRVANIAEATVDDLKVSLQSKADEALAGIGREIAERIEKPLRHMIDRLKAYKVSEDSEGKQKTEGIFRDTLVSHVGEIAELIPLLNIGNDPAIAGIAARLKAECLTSPDILRDSATARAETVKSAESVLSALGGIL
jgi:hypothetical protein